MAASDYELTRVRPVVDPAAKRWRVLTRVVYPGGDIRIEYVEVSREQARAYVDGDPDWHKVGRGLAARLRRLFRL